MRGLLSKFISDKRGVVLTETLIALPILLLITVGLLEFGNMMWQRQQLQVGVRDAARYWARCRPTSGAGTPYMPCSISLARNIAFTGDPTGTSPLRVPGWDDAAELQIDPAAPPTSPISTDLVSVRGEVNYQGSALYDRLIGSNFSIGYNYTTRYVGW